MTAVVPDIATEATEGGQPASEAESEAAEGEDGTVALPGHEVEPMVNN